MNMSKYRELTLHLASRDDEIWTASFDEVEEAMGQPLPGSARQYPAWWANQGRAQSQAWELAGWKTSAVDVANERVTFVYVGGEEGPKTPDAPKLTIAEAKAGLAANFNVAVDAIEIVIRG